MEVLQAAHRWRLAVKGRTEAAAVVQKGRCVWAGRKWFYLAYKVQFACNLDGKPERFLGVEGEGTCGLGHHRTP